MQTGIVRWFNCAKGYGFLSQEDGPDVFVHYSAIQHEGYKALKEGAAVSYAIETGASGRLQAANVVSIPAAASSPHQPSPEPTPQPESDQRPGRG